MDYEIIKTYVTVSTDKGRLELKFFKNPTEKDIQEAVNEVTKPEPEPTKCPHCGKEM